MSDDKIYLDPNTLRVFATDKCVTGLVSLNNHDVNYNLILNKYFHYNNKKSYFSFSQFNTDLSKYLTNKKEKFIKIYENNKYKSINILAKNTAILVIGHGEISVREVSIKLDHIYGIPFISASSIKGAFRYYLNEKYSTSDDENSTFNENSLITEIFGSDKKEGKIIFLDIYPENFSIGQDVMTPHYSDYYSKNKAPLDSSSPVPINFPAINEGAKFEFIILSKDENYSKVNEKTNETLTINIKEEFRNFINEKALGAKSSVGYGYFKTDK